MPAQNILNGSVLQTNYAKAPVLYGTQTAEVNYAANSNNLIPLTTINNVLNPLFEMGYVSQSTPGIYVMNRPGHYMIELMVCVRYVAGTDTSGNLFVARSINSGAPNAINRWILPYDSTSNSVVTFFVQDYLNISPGLVGVAFDFKLITPDATFTNNHPSGGSNGQGSTRLVLSYMGPF